MNGISYMIVAGIGVVAIAEISTYPLGFALYIDLQTTTDQKGGIDVIC